MADFQKKITRCYNKQKNIIWQKNQSRYTDTGMTGMINLAGADVKVTIINMLQMLENPSNKCD